MRSNGHIVLWVCVFFLIVIFFELFFITLASIFGNPVPDDLHINSCIFALLLVYLLRDSDS